MLTELQKLNFCKATAEWNGNDFEEECARVCEPTDVAATQETVADFIKQWGTPNITKTPAGDLMVWKNIQIKKRLRRGDSFLMDFGNVRAGYFTGETL
jgi:hypothetical protein